MGPILTRLELRTEVAIRKAPQEPLGVEVVDILLVRFDPIPFERVFLNLIRKQRLLPLKAEAGKLCVAMIGPHSLVAIDEIKFPTGSSRLLVTTCTDKDFDHFLEENRISKRGGMGGR